LPPGGDAVPLVVAIDVAFEHLDFFAGLVGLGENPGLAAGLLDDVLLGVGREFVIRVFFRQRSFAALVSCARHRRRTGPFSAPRWRWGR
jgi:hypothetical protein